VAADAFQLPFSDGSFDYVYCSLFLHHFEDKEIVELLRGFRRVARRAVVVVDLHRHGFSRWFLRATQPVFGWDAVTVSDGEISVEAGFRPSELRQLADQAGLDQARVRMHWPWFRLSVVSSV
jgi:ubiquinone/menaquinone biosynthesis C-methylase UbiE